MSCYNSTVPSSPPRDVMVESHNPASLMVSWRPPVGRDRNGPITGYMINYIRVGSSDMMSMSVTGDIRVIIIPELVAYVNYSVILAAMTVNGTGPFSDPPVVGRSGEDRKLNYSTAQFKLYTCVQVHMCACTFNTCKTSKLAFVHTFACDFGVCTQDSKYTRHTRDIHVTSSHLVCHTTSVV